MRAPLGLRRTRELAKQRRGIFVPVDVGFAIDQQLAAAGCLSATAHISPVCPRMCSLALTSAPWFSSAVPPGVIAMMRHIAMTHITMPPELRKLIRLIWTRHDVPEVVLS